MVKNQILQTFLYFFNTNATCHMLKVFYYNYCKKNILHWFNTKNTITCDRKGLHHDLEIFQARCFVRFFSISSTPMQPVTYNEFSLIIMVKQSILHWFNTKNTNTCDRKSLHHDLEIFQARCLGRFFCISSTPMQPITCDEFLLIIIVK
jgi:hypothetical protein